jgi:hypothetical protein
MAVSFTSIGHTLGSTLHRTLFYKAKLATSRFYSIQNISFLWCFFGFLEGQDSSLKSQLKKMPMGWLATWDKGYKRQSPWGYMMMVLSKTQFASIFSSVWEPHFLALGIPKPYASRHFVGLALVGKDVVFRFIIEYIVAQEILAHTR